MKLTNLSRSKKIAIVSVPLLTLVWWVAMYLAEELTGEVLICVKLTS